MALKPINLGTLQTQNPYLNPGSLPNLTGLTKSATNILQSELQGMPNPAETRTANAAWGVQAGLPPGSGFLENRGRRLYQSEVENRRRQGLQDLLSFLKGYSGTVSATPGQLLNYGQRNQEKNFENAMALWQQQMAQRQMDEANAKETAYSYNPGVADPFSLYKGYNYTKDRTGRIIQR